jgi:hypothetical protein
VLYNNDFKITKQINSCNIVNPYNSINKADMDNFHKKIRKKNVSQTDSAKLLAAQKESSKFKKINKTNIPNLNNFINVNNNIINNNLNGIPFGNTVLSYSNKSPLKKPPVSTIMAPLVRKNLNISSKTKNPNLNFTSNSAILNGSTGKNKNGEIKRDAGTKAADKISFNLNLTSNNFNNTLATEDNLTNAKMEILNTRSTFNNSAIGRKSNANETVGTQNLVNNNSLYQGSVIHSKNKFNLIGKFIENF